MFKYLIGDRAFYKRLLTLMIPIMVQNGITNFVNMLDNLMVGRIGTAEMTGVAITNQLLFVFNLCIFGIVSGAGIFSAQFFGSCDNEGVRHTFRFKILFGGLITLLGIGLFIWQGAPLINLYMQGEQSATNAAATLGFAHQYLMIMLIGLLPYTFVQCYSSTLREIGRPLVPMVSGIAAVCTNLILNYVLIFGKCGAPRLGVVGAAIATAISRFVELIIITVYTHSHHQSLPFINGAFKSLYVPRRLIGQLFAKGLPLMLNESLWAAGIATVNQAYSMSGLDAVAACNISQTFWMVFSIAYMAVGAAIGILLGQMLGSNQLKTAKQAAFQMSAFSFVLALTVAIGYIVCAEFIPLAYNTTPEIRRLATRAMQLTALAMPFDAVAHSSYFTLRSGGKTFITMLFDCGGVWGVNVLLAITLSRFTSIPFLGLFAIIQGVTVIKAIIGVLLVKNDFWVRNIVSAERNP